MSFLFGPCVCQEEHSLIFEYSRLKTPFAKGHNMKYRITGLLYLLTLSLLADIRIDKNAYSLRISDDGTRFLGITGKTTGVTFAENAELWEMQFNNGMKLNASQFMKAPFNGKFSSEKTGDKLTLHYTSSACGFEIVFNFHEEAFDYRVMNLKNREASVMMMAVPAQLTFPLNNMKRFLYPTQANWSMGICFLPSFFEKRTENDAIYKPADAPFNGMRKLFDSKNIPLKNNEYKQKDRAVPARFGETFYNASEKSEILKNVIFSISKKQEKKGSFELEFLCLQNNSNPLLAATQFGGKGYLFQMFASNQNAEQRVPGMRTIFQCTVSALLRHSPEMFKGKHIVLLDYPNMPRLITGFDPVSNNLHEWKENLSAFSKKFNIPVKYAKNPDEMRVALNDDSVGLIVNPYGNVFPSDEPARFAADLESVRKYVKRGGIWWEAGSQSFDTLIRKLYYSEYDREARYPSAAADYACAEYANGSIAMFGIQPTMRFPYDRERAAIPASYDLRGSDQGAAFTHRWVLWANSESKRPWDSSPYRISFKYKTPREGLAAYEKTLELHAKLTDKVKPETLDKLKSAMLVCIWHETAADNIKSFKIMPPNNIAHFIGALASRFDANYPEHLPPDPKWGTLEDLRNMVEEGHKSGHLLMPYTNTTWWLPHENGTPSPSQQKWMNKKEEVMKLTVAGTPEFRRGRTGIGWALNFYHPYVQEASLKVTKQFTSYGCDMIFMDEMGGHPWTYDFSPREPRPATALDGRISMCWDSSKVLPTATEEGHDRLLNFNTLFCGGTWKTFPNGNFETQRYVHQYRPQDWQYWPVFIYLGHDKALFTIHDLLVRYAGFEEISLALSLGYKMKDVFGWRSPESRLDWLHYLDAIQKTVAKEYEGQSLLKFVYPFEAEKLPYSNQVVYSEFAGGVRMICNHSDKEVPLKNIDLPFPATELEWLRGQSLPPYGFYVSTANGKCAYLNQNKNLFGFALAMEKGTYRGVFFTRSKESVYTLPDTPAWQTGSFAGSSGKLNIHRRGGRLEFTVPFAGTPEKISWWFSHYDPNKAKAAWTLPLILNGKADTSDKKISVLSRNGVKEENGAMIFGDIPKRKLLLRLPENFGTMTLAADITVSALPEKGLAPIVVRPGCNSIFGINTYGQVMLSIWYADRKTQNHVISGIRLKSGEKARIAAVVDCKDQQTTLKLIVNGREEASLTTAQKPYPYGPLLNIAPWGRKENSFIGSVRNLFISNQALSPEAVMALQ